MIPLASSSARSLLLRATGMYYTRAFRAGALEKRVYIEPILHWSVKRVKGTERKRRGETEIERNCRHTLYGNPQGLLGWLSIDRFFDSVGDIPIVMLESHQESRAFESVI